MGTADLCPYYQRMVGTYGHQALHGKKLVSTYLGRMTLAQVRPFQDAGWHLLFSPGDSAAGRGEARCFDESRWRFFDAFFRGHDFSGLQVYVDLLPPSCLAEFTRRYGEPVARAELPRVGTAVVFARPAERSPAPGPLVLPFSGSVDILGAPGEDGMVVAGLSTLERLGDDRWRWAEGKETVLRTRCEEPTILEVVARFVVPMADQTVHLEVDGATVAAAPAGRSHRPVEWRRRVELAAGVHVLRFGYSDWNHGARAFAPSDPRQLAVQFTELRVNRAE